MRRTLLAIVFGTLAVGGMTLAQHGRDGNGGVQVKLLSQKDIIESVQRGGIIMRNNQARC